MPFDLSAFKVGRLLSRRSADLSQRNKADVQLFTKTRLHVLHAKKSSESVGEFSLI